MSEPMSSGEIEDVLSSIRKLVSEDLRPAAVRGKDPQADPRPKARLSFGQDEADKLLLTPAFRVVEDRTSPKVAPGAEPEVASDSLSGETPSAVATSADGLPPPLALDESLRTDRAGSDGHEPPEAPAQAEHMDALSRGARIEQDAGDSGIGAALSTIGSAVDQNKDDWESETGDGGFASLAWKAPQWVEEAEIVTPAAPPVVEDPAQSLSLEEAEAAEAAARAEIEAAESAAVSEEIHDAARVDRNGASSASHSDGDMRACQDEPAADLFADDEPYYDEALLRDLVRDIIREELSGTLGERITRNVRKLVRAEIARAMTAREFE